MVPAVRHAKTKFKVGETIPTSGLYQVFHSIHRVSHEVTLLHGEVFPPCSKCGDNVAFELLRAAPEIDKDYDFRVRLFQIPHPAEDESAERKKA